MSSTKWMVEGDEDGTFEHDGRRYATGDSGAPMLCSQLCRSLGRHVHIDQCRTDEEETCQLTGVQHINSQNGSERRDWVTHALFWERSGGFSEF